MLEQQRKDIAYLRACQLSISLVGVADRYERLVEAWEDLIEAWEDLIEYVDESAFTELEYAILKDAKGE